MLKEYVSLPFENERLNGISKLANFLLAEENGILIHRFELIELGKEYLDENNLSRLNDLLEILIRCLHQEDVSDKSDTSRSIEKERNILFQEEIYKVTIKQLVFEIMLILRCGSSIRNTTG